MSGPAAHIRLKVFYYINQLQFSIVRRTALSYDLLYFCLPAGRLTEVCVIVIFDFKVFLPLERLPYGG